jgi:membrane fusion protein
MSSLFRKEALEHRKDRLFGDVILLQPFSMTVLVICVVIIVSLVLSVLFWGTYARKETVKGFLVPDKGVVKIYGPQQGNISQVLVKEGDKVTEGTTLVTIVAERGTTGGGDIDSKILHELEESKLQSSKRITSEKELQTAEAEKLKSQIDGITKELLQIKESLSTQEERMQLARSRVTAAEKLKASSNISQTEYQKILEEFLNTKQQYQELERAYLSKETSLKQVTSDLEQLPIKIQTRVEEIQSGISELNQRMVEVSGRKSSEIRSPIDGQVTSLQAQPGQWQANVPLMSILPNEAYLQAELYVPSRAIGFVETGQIVKVRFDAFPYQRYGIHSGVIKSISKNIFTQQELPVPIEIKEPVYRIIVSLDSQSVQAYGKKFPLQTGMLLEADIILDKQSLFDWMLDPLLSLKGKF